MTDWRTQLREAFGNTAVENSADDNLSADAALAMRRVVVAAVRADAEAPFSLRNPLAVGAVLALMVASGVVAGLRMPVPVDEPGVTPTSFAIAGMVTPSSSYRTRMARRRGGSVSSACRTSDLAIRGGSGSKAACAATLPAALARVLTADCRQRSRQMLISTRTSHASSFATPTGIDRADRAARRNVSCTRSCASSVQRDRRRASLNSR